jgi:hypothetical protein
MNARAAGYAALGLGAVVLLALLLLLPRMSTVQVHGEVRTSSLQFTLIDPGQLLERNELDWLAAGGVVRLDGPGTSVESADGQVSFLDTLAGPGALRLSRLRLPADARVAMHAGLGPRFLELAFACAGGCAPFQLDADGRHFVRVNDAAAPVQGRRNYRLAGGDGTTTTLLLRAAAGQPLDVGRNLRVDQLVFTRLSESTANGVEREAEVLSAVGGGTLRFPELPDRVYELTPGSHLSLDLREAEIEALSVRADTIAVSFSGTARGIVLGSGAGAREILPRRIEWLYARRNLMLLITFLVGLLTGAVALRALLERKAQ